MVARGGHHEQRAAGILRATFEDELRICALEVIAIASDVVTGSSKACQLSSALASEGRYRYAVARARIRESATCFDGWRKL